MAKPLNIGMIGHGFMGRAHSNAYHRVNQFFDVAYQPVLKAVAGRNPETTRAFASRWSWQRAETDWRKLVDAQDIDAIDICSPNNTHCEVALAAAAAGKIILCEKPLAMNLAEARQMTVAVEKSGKPNMVWFNYRRVPAISLAKQIIDEGRLGKIFHYRAVYLQDWTISRKVPVGGPGTWRLDKDVAGAGVSGDLSTHNVDTALWLNGAIASVSGMTEIFIKDRTRPDGSPARVEIDDVCTFLARFVNGSNGTFEATRYARGRKNKNSFEVNGENGSLYFDLENMHQLQYFNHQDPEHLQGWRTILVTGAEHPYMANWWVPGCVIGYEHTFVNALADFLKCLQTGERIRPDFRDALETQAVMDAVLESASTGDWRTPEATEPKGKANA
ncbi:MAG TPA: Gfo/Idh/MocA family oxidoreductase [Terriglobia bacterium]|nr:Gfo/Idh/MocA family oxidoreductase [Terriglobia bacterium]